MAKSGAPEHKVWVIAGDGCLMEGISHEACSLAGHLQLNNLILLHDNNGITIDGKKSLADSEDTIKRFEAYGWYTQSIDGHDFAEISAALANARASELPAFISCRTIIGYGAPTKAGSEASHGAALGKAEASQTKASYGWEHDRHFHVPEHLLKVWRHLSSQRLGDLSERLREPRSPYHLGPQATGEMSNCMRSQIVRFSSALHAQENLTSGMTTYESTRKSSGIILSELTHQYPWLIGGSADLTESNYTSGHSNRIPITRDNFDGNYIYYGIREHAMGAVMNGLALSGLVPYGGSFLVFIDYCKPAVRLAALMKLQVIYVMTHDSIGLGEDGPTHQPIEQLASLRSMPNISVLRPADTTETRECWQIALESTETPTVLCLTRQDVPQVRSYSKENLCKKGAYVLSEFEGELKVTIFATGSEVSIALDAQKALHEKGIGTRIISMPSMELFERQSDEYKSELLDQNSIKVAVEAASRFGWDRYIGRNGIFIGMDDFGASGKGPELYKHFGITSERICAACLYALAN
jgi:transketolase